MEPTTQFVSLDGTALEGEIVDFRAEESALARRSISIFSRRGIEDHPEARPPFIAQGIMRTPRERSERQKSWMRRRSAPVLSGSPKKARGTVLNAVPAAKTIQMTPLEEEMSGSPNDEKLSALESPVSTRLVSASPSSPQSPGQWAKQDRSPSQRTKSTRRKSAQTRIGVWMNGVVHWDENACLERIVGTEEPSSLPETGFTPIQPMPAEQLNVLRGSRPQLSVVIPGCEPLVNDTTISTIVLNSEMRPRSLVSVAPANIVSKFASGPSRVQEEPLTVSSPEETRVPIAPQIIVENAEGATENASRQSNSSSSEVSLVERDDGSSHSRRSSATSIEVQPTRERELKPDRLALTGSQAFSIISPAAGGVFDGCPKGIIDVNKPLPPPPVTEDTPDPSPISTRGHTQLRHVSSTRSEPTLRAERQLDRSWRTIELEPVDPDSTRVSSYLLSISAPNSPTLSQAELELETALSTIEEPDRDAGHVRKTSSIHRGNSVHSVMHPPERAPTLPRRSRKRDWRSTRDVRETFVRPAKLKSPRHRKSEADLLRRPLDFTQDDAASMRSLRKSCSSYELHDIGKAISTGWKPVQEPSTLPQVAYEDGLIVLNGPVTLQKVMDDALLTVSSAEDVLLHILEALPSTTALFNTALINKGMYRVYKENEMHLIRAVTRNQSPAAWELREWCPPEPSNSVPQSAASSQIEHSPLSYMRGHRRDLEVIERLKGIILERCQTFIRRETAFALSSRGHPDSQRFDDAFFRICCFCKIFGSNKGREEDITGQLDWLKGGILANSSDLSATMNMNLEFEMSSVLLNPPDHFARGNEGGLSAQQLYDITEIWTCLTSLLHPYLGQTRQAIRCGVYEGCEVFDGDEEREEYLLEEWTAHLLTLGPAVILEMADLASSAPYGFALAKSCGWTDWTPPQYSGSRTSFLREPVSRLYEERISAAALTLRNPAEREKREMSRKRVATLAAEIRLARQSSTFKRLPLIDQAHERAMSVLTRQGSNASNFSYHGAAPPPPSCSSSHSPTPGTGIGLTRSASVTSQRHPSRAPHFSTPRPLEPKMLVHSQHHRRKISPIIEDKVETFNRMSCAPRPGDFAAAPDTSEVAIKRITEMGFTRREAQQALRETDMGDGLRLDRAVEMLLKRMG